MSSHSIPSLQQFVWCGPNGWLLRTERLLSTTCMGWCLHASFKEHPKSTTIAYVGGASSIFLANFFHNRLASQTLNGRLLRAGGLLSLAGISWCLHIAFDEHPKAAIKACLAGALSFCLAKSVISDPSATVDETPRNIDTITKGVLDESEIHDSYSEINMKIQDQIRLIGKQLNQLCQDYDGRKGRSVGEKLGLNLLKKYFKRL